MTQSEITQLSKKFTGFAIKIHKGLGLEVLESVYEKCLKCELEKNNYQVEK